MRKLLKDQRGSISVLVVLLVIVLASFGALTIGLSYTSNKLSEKNIEWSETYYYLEGIAHKELAKLDTVIAEGYKSDSKNLAEYINDKDYGWEATATPEGVDITFTVSYGSDPGDMNLKVIASVNDDDFTDNGFVGSGSRFKVVNWTVDQIRTAYDGLDDFDGTVKE